MEEEAEYQCLNCSWSGYETELVCNDADEDKPVEESRFDTCPQCGSTEFEIWDEYDD